MVNMLSGRSGTRGDGQPTFLDAGIVHGLFEAASGNRCLVARNNGRKTVIALNHASLPKFSVVKRADQTFEYGQWSSTCWLRLSRCRTNPVCTDAGVLQVYDSGVYLSCLSGDAIKWVLIGKIDYLADEGFYRKWSIEGISARSILFNHGKRSKTLVTTMDRALDQITELHNLRMDF